MRGIFLADAIGMGGARVIDLTAVVAACEGPLPPARGSARRVLTGACPLPAALSEHAYEVARTCAAAPPGRVIGAGQFTDEATRSALAAWLPPPLAAALRSGFEWYGCRAAHFHNDAHYADVLFGAWCAAGPAREVVFARHGVRVPTSPGAVVVFDPFEPHAVLAPGDAQYAREHYADAAPSVFIAFEIELTAPVRAALGIVPPPAGAPVLSSRIPVHAQTGAVG
jgi:hypothetical protein